LRTSARSVLIWFFVNIDSFSERASAYFGNASMSVGFSLSVGFSVGL
jgi:hypothetical protein